MVLRAMNKMLCKLRGHQTVFPIAMELFNVIAKKPVDSGWVKKSDYQGVYAWIDGGSIRLRNGREKLFLEWDNLGEGSIQGTVPVLTPMARKYNLPIVDSWRWSTEDDKNG